MLVYYFDMTECERRDERGRKGEGTTTTASHEEGKDDTNSQSYSHPYENHCYDDSFKEAMMSSPLMFMSS